MGRAVRDRRRVLHTFVLRLVSSELDEERIVGRIESAETGRTGVVHGIDELARFLTCETADDDAGPPGNGGRQR
jgi:hypothetical protein